MWSEGEWWEVRVGVRGSEGLVRECVGPLGDAPCSRNAPPRRRG
jgi:hypothetical protein